MPFDAEISTKSRDLLILERARAWIAQGWCQHSGIRRGKRGQEVCTGGAVVQTLTVMKISPPEYEALLAAALNNLGFEKSIDHVLWNDAPGRTQAEVLARFDVAIARLSA